MKAYAEDSKLSEIRRRDRAVEDEGWIRDFLTEAPIGVVATSHDGQPFLNANTFVYDEKEHAIYMHTARTGRTRENVDANSRVCFTAFEMGRLLPADIALEFSVEYRGVTAFGNATIIEKPHEAKRALQLLLDKYFGHLKPERDYRPTNDEELKRASVYKIQIEQWSAKEKKVKADFPGAFFYSEKNILLGGEPPKG